MELDDGNQPFEIGGSFNVNHVNNFRMQLLTEIDFGTLETCQILSKTGPTPAKIPPQKPVKFTFAWPELLPFCSRGYQQKNILSGGGEHKYIYIYIYACAHLCRGKYACVCRYRRILRRMRNMSVYEHANQTHRIHTYVHACIYIIYIYISRHVYCIYIYVYIYIYICIFTCLYICTTYPASESAGTCPGIDVRGLLPRIQQAHLLIAKCHRRTSSGCCQSLKRRWCLDVAQGQETTREGSVRVDCNMCHAQDTLWSC